MLSFGEKKEGKWKHVRPFFLAFKQGGGVAFQRGSVTVASLCQRKGTPAISDVWCCTTAPLYSNDDNVCLTLIAAQLNRRHLSPLSPNRMFHWTGLLELIKATFRSIFPLSKTMNWMFVAAEDWRTVKTKANVYFAFFISAVWMWSKINPYIFAMVHCFHLVTADRFSKHHCSMQKIPLLAKYTGR